ncbi:MAG: polysaccharide deacetylase family protein [Firmicutes bacterium]|nr:polysaccharide deacetylase family protein [Bacillota bacterium]
MGKRTSLVVNVSIAVVLLGLSVVVFTTDLSGIYMAVSGPHYNGNRNNQNVSIMINVYDNAHTQHIKQMMDILEDRDVDATWFVSGNWVKRNMALAKDMSERFELGNLGLTHRNMRNLSEANQRIEIQGTHDLVMGVAGVEMNLFAPPNGNFNRTTLRVAESLGYTTIMWSKDTIDWRDKDANIVFNRATQNIMNGDLVLMHPCAHSLAALPLIIDYYLSRGFDVVRVSENIL